MFLQNLKQIDLNKDDDSEDEEYKPNQVEINEFKREQEKLKQKQKGEKDKNQKSVEEIWQELQNQTLPVRQKQIKMEGDNLMKFSEKILEYVDQQEADKKKVMFAGQQFTVNENGEIVGRADKKKEAEEVQVEQEAKVQILIDENEEQTQQKAEPSQQELVFQREEKIRNELRVSFAYLGSVLDQIQNQAKSINSIMKSKMDWKVYTQKEKMEQEFTQNRQDGYLEQQKFLVSSQIQQKQFIKNSKASLSSAPSN